MDMDICICLQRLNLRKNNWTLDASAPPHKITEWFGPDPQPTNASLEATWAEYESELAATEYQRDRIYPSWKEQADLQYWDLVNGTTTWKDAIAKVKADHPKP